MSRGKDHPFSTSSLQHLQTWHETRQNHHFSKNFLTVYEKRNVSRVLDNCPLNMQGVRQAMAAISKTAHRGDNFVIDQTFAGDIAILLHYSLSRSKWWTVDERQSTVLEDGDFVQWTDEWVRIWNRLDGTWRPPKKVCLWWHTDESNLAVKALG